MDWFQSPTMVSDRSEWETPTTEPQTTPYTCPHHRPSARQLAASGYNLSVHALTGLHSLPMLQSLGFGTSRQLQLLPCPAQHPHVLLRDHSLSSRQHNPTRPRTLISCSVAASAAAHQPPVPTRYAIIGAGLAGVAMAWHLIDKTRRSRAQGGGHGRPIEVLVFDAAGILAGGSGSAAGLLHAFTPRGKPIWQGEQAMRATMELVQVAALHAAHEQHVDVDAGSAEGSRHKSASTGSREQLGAQHSSHSHHPASRQAQPTARPSLPAEDALAGPSFPPASSSCSSPSSSFLWYNGLVRPAANAKQAVNFYQSCHPSGAGPETAAQSVGLPGPAEPAGSGSAAPGAGSRLRVEAGALSGKCITPAELQQLLPGLQLLPWVRELQEPQGRSDGRLADPSSSSSSEQQAEHAHAANQTETGATRGEEVAGGAGGEEEPAGPSDQELAGSYAAFHIPGGVVMDVQQYLPGLWRACQAAAAGLGDGSQARLVLGSAVHSLELLEQEQGPFAAVVVAAGAAAGTVQEVAALNLPLKICQGYSLFLSPGPRAAALEQQQQGGSGQGPLPEHQHPGGPQGQGQAQAQGQGPHPLFYPDGAPSILGQVYMAAHGSNRLVVGATRSYGWTAQEALDMCRMQPRHGDDAGQTSVTGAPESVTAEPSGSTAAPGGGRFPPGADEVAPEPSTSSNSSSSSISSSNSSSKNKRKSRGRQHPKNSAAAAQAAKEELLAAASAHWPPVSGWQVDEIRSGMRALPPRAAAGAIPLAGRVREGRPWWFIAGLGARGLVYHAWLAQVVAAAVLGDDESLVQPEALLAWRSVGAAGQPVVFDQP